MINARSGASGSPFGGGKWLMIPSRISSSPNPFLGAGHDSTGGIDSDDILDVLSYPFRIGARQIDLVDHRKNLQVVIESHMDIRHRLRLDSLRSIDDQQGTLASPEAPRYFVSKIDVTRRIDQIQFVLFAVFGLGSVNRPGLP